MRVFGLGYVDDRTTILKTDNRPAPIRTKDVGKIQLATYGGDYVQVINTTNAGKFDFLAWGVFQGGSWGALTQRAGAFVGEFGWQPPVKHLKPWLSAGYSYGSGDGNPNDSTHGTFFQALTTPRQYARFPFYNMMNNEDFYATLNLKPRVETGVAQRRACPAAGQCFRLVVFRRRRFSTQDFWIYGPSQQQLRRPGQCLGRQRGLPGHPLSERDLLYGHAWGETVIAKIYPKDPNGQLFFLETNYHF